MKYERKVTFKCDHCRKNVTNKRHIRILLGWTSGWMAPPFTGGIPVNSVADRRPEFHFCKPECMAAHFVTKFNELRTDTRKHKRSDRIAPVSREVLAESGTQRSPVRWEDYVGTRYPVQRKEGERSLGDRVPVLVVSSRGRHGENDQRMDSNQSHEEEGRIKVPSLQLGAEEKVSKRFVWSIKNIWQMIYGRKKLPVSV